MNIHKIPLVSPKDKVLMQLSGGKDSIACMILLKEYGVKIEAIHFTHAYGYSLPTSMAKKTCEALGVSLHIEDITSSIETVFFNGFNGRPCRYCKGIMDKITMDYAIRRSCSLICVGDTKDDKTLINRLREKEKSINPISRYFNQVVQLPEEISIYRPLLEYDGSETLKIVQNKFSWFQRINDTGDKYFEYSREGCPLQFKDYGAQYTKELVYELKHLNTLCGEFASQKGIRASIHLPSEFIVTIPQGYENECRQYLQSHGAKLLYKPKENPKIHHILIDININQSMRDYNIIKMVCDRLLERLSICGKLNFVNKIGHLSKRAVIIDVVIIDIDRLIISIMSKEARWQPTFVEGLCVEIFHTRDFNVLIY